jgi:hypothetical protein
MNHLVPGAGWEEYGPAFGGHDFVKQLNLVSITCSNEAETIQRGGDHEDIDPIAIWTWQRETHFIWWPDMVCGSRPPTSQGCT